MTPAKLNDLLLEEWEALSVSTHLPLAELQLTLPFLVHEVTDQSVEATVNQALQAADTSVERQASALSEEELASIWRKLVDGTQTPGTSLEREDELYLEQQLTDILGVEIAAQIDGYRLPATFAVSTLIDDWKMSAAEATPAARPDLGWTSAEQHPLLLRGISLPLFTLPAWTTNREVLWQWYARRPVVVCNPILKRASLAYIVSQGPDEWWRYQVGVTALLAEELGLWSYPGSTNVALWLTSTPEKAAHLPNPAARTHLQHLIDQDYFGPSTINVMSSLSDTDTLKLTSLLLLRFLTLYANQTSLTDFSVLLKISTRQDWGNLGRSSDFSQQGFVSQVRDSSERLLQTLTAN